MNIKRIGVYIKRNKSAAVSIFVVIVVCIILVLKNYKRVNFLSANAIDIITILLVALITFYLTEQLNDRRRRNDCIEHIIIEIENYISNDDNFKINKNSLIKQTSCANRIKYMKDADFPDIKEDIEFIESHFQEIRDIYSNHNKSDEELANVKVDIDKHRDYIIDKCCKIRIGLYSYS